MQNPNKVILHCTATPDQGDLIGVEQIREWHLARGWNDVGYHHVIRRSGVIEPGRKENIIGAHTKGFNKNSLGVALVGTKDFTLQQVSSLKVIYKDILSRHGIDYGNWYCHYEFSNKTCPNVPINVIKELLRLTP